MEVEEGGEKMSNAKAKKLPSGNYRCRAYYTDELGNYKSKSFTADTKKEAERLVAAFLIDVEHSKRPENKTLGQLADTFIENRSNILSPSTIAGYRKIRRTAFQDIIDVRLELLTKELYQKAINEYAKTRSSKTVLSAHVFFNRLLKENDINIGDKVILPQKQSKEIAIPTTEEVEKFLSNIAGTRLYLYVLFAVTLGLRMSEVIAIKWEDIDLINKTVSINKSRVRDEYRIYVEKETKTFSGTRTLHLPSVLVEALPEEGDPNEYVINDSPAALESLYKREAVKADFPYNFHALRHYYASVMMTMGVPNKYAMERMGHATETMLKRVYQHTFEQKQQEIDMLMDDVMSVFSTKEKTPAAGEESE